mmetsp:Transcript_54444/g.127100  ORF Transcript_54444/g.127100 Transcript_54444/m.127100 type:complete len:675 (-) Transcript_54444:160-2184(-)
MADERPFQEIADKVIVEEGGNEFPHYPVFGDVVTVELRDGDKVPEYRSWTIGTGAPLLLPCGLDLDRCVRTMRKGERSKVRAKGGAVSDDVLSLLAHERAEDLLSNGKLVRNVIQDGTGWATPTASSEIRIRYSWCTVPRMTKGEAAMRPTEDSSPGEVEVTLAPGSMTADILDPDMLSMRRLLMRAFGPPVVWRSAAVGEDAKFDGPVLSVVRGEHVLASSEQGLSCTDAKAKVEASLLSLTSIQQPLQKESQETIVRFEDSGCLCEEPDFMPGNIAMRVLMDMRMGQIQMVRVAPELASTIPGLQDHGVPEDAVVEYDIELLNIMTLEDVSVLKNGGLMKKTIKEGEGYDKIVEGAKVSVKLQVSDKGTRILDEKEVNFEAASGEYCVALDEVILKMKPKEVCEVRCADSALSKDDKLGILPQAGSQITLGIEVLEAEKIELYTSDDSLRVEHCTKRKEVGTRFFQAGEWRRALLRYQHIIRTLSYLEHWEDAEARKAAVTLRRVAHLNAAMCLLKLEAWRAAEEEANEVLKEEPDNVKALFRRGQALNQLAEYRDAEQCFRKCLEFDKENKEATRMVLKVRQSLKAESEKEKLMFSKMTRSIGSASTDSNSPAPTVQAGGSARPAAQNGSTGKGADPLNEEDTVSLGYILGATVLLAACGLAVYFVTRKHH